MNVKKTINILGDETMKMCPCTKISSNCDKFCVLAPQKSNHLMVS
jgi:hypothetical protein